MGVDIYAVDHKGRTGQELLEVNRAAVPVFEQAGYSASREGGREQQNIAQAMLDLSRSVLAVRRFAPIEGYGQYWTPEQVRFVYARLLDLGQIALDLAADYDRHEAEMQGGEDLGRSVAGAVDALYFLGACVVCGFGIAFV